MSETTTQHTRGDWLYNPDEVNHEPEMAESAGSIQSEVDGFFLAKIESLGNPEEEVANALLMAAAPDLLEALKAVVAVADRKTMEFDRAHTAIAKAEGGDR